jgi:hypothetical protein
VVIKRRRGKSDIKREMTIELPEKIYIYNGSFGLCQIYRAGIIQIAVPLSFVERNRKRKNVWMCFISFPDFVFSKFSFFQIFIFLIFNFQFSGFYFLGFFRFRIFTFENP